MVRPKNCRRIYSTPDVTYFKPRGIPLNKVEESVLAFDEYEAIRLKDLEGLEQEECAKKMGISQPTFHRLIISARKKVADAIVNSKALKIHGGNFQIMNNKINNRRFDRGFGYCKGKNKNCGW